MDLVVVQIDLAMQESKAAASTWKVIDHIESRYKHPQLLLTVDYGSYKHLLGLGIRTRLFTEELAPEVEEEIIQEAQRKAEEIIRKFGEALLFEDINPIDILHYDITTHIAGILRIKHVFQSNASQPGTILLFTSSKGLRKETDSDLPVLDLFEIGGASRWGYLGAFFRFVLRKRIKTCNAENNPKPAPSQPSPGVSRKKVLFVTVDNRICVDPLTPVLRKLRESSDLEPLVAVDSPSTQEYLEEGLIENLAYRQYYDILHSILQWAKSFRTLRGVAIRLGREHKNGTVDALLTSSVRQQFINLWTLVSVYSRILWAEKVFELSRPSAVVAYPLHSHVVRAAISLARVRNVPAVVFVYSWVYGQKPGGDLLSFRTYDNSDVIIATGEDCKQALVMDGVNPKKVLLVGNPKFDVIASATAAQDRENLLRLLRVGPTDLVFLVASYMLSPGTAQWLRALVRQLKMFPNTFKLIVRPHPDESPAEYERILAEEKFSGATISTDISLYSLLNASDIVFTGMSTVGSEAVLFDKPLICLNLSTNPYSVRYDEDGVALLVKKEEEILPTIETILYNKEIRREIEGARRRFREALAYKLDGGASERFVEAIRFALASSPTEVSHGNTTVEESLR